MKSILFVILAISFPRIGFSQQLQNIVDLQITSDFNKGFCTRPAVISSTLDEKNWIDVVRKDDNSKDFFSKTKKDLQAAMASFAGNKNFSNLHIIVMLERNCRYKKLSIYDRSSGDKLSEFATDQEVSQGTPWTISKSSSLYERFGFTLIKNQIDNALKTREAIKKSRAETSQIIIR